MDLIKLNPSERVRTYYYKDGSCVSFNDVKQFKASLSTHRLGLGNGKLIIVPIDNLKYIEIDVDGFTL